MTEQDISNQPKPTDNRSIATFVYALHAASFILGVTYFVAIVVNYVKLDDVKGTWIESHFRWQIRTFWFTLLWGIVGAILAFIFIGYFVLLANMIWYIYRIVKGWINLSEGKSMYMDSPL